MNRKFIKSSFVSFSSFEDLPDINQSLKMINTINMLPNQPSYEDIELPVEQVDQQYEEDSIAGHISHVPTTNNSAKKKKVGCTCKKTFCLKMYCECFSTGKECGQECACNSCKNTVEFKQQIAQAKNNIKEGGLRNCSLAKKRCNCKKSNCLKRYCECYNSGMGCSQACRCQGCKNIDKPQQLVQNSIFPSPLSENELKSTKKIKAEFPSFNKYNSAEDFSRYYE